MREGVERFMITDINNAASTSNLRHELLNADFEDPEVRRRIAQLAREAHSGSVLFEEPRAVYWTGHNTEEYDHLDENRFLEAAHTPLSTFSIDVDTASYANVRRYLSQGALPPRGAVRIEELINYFSYDYPVPDGGTPFATHLEVARCPWKPGNLLARIGLKGWEMDADDRPSANLVFLVDVSGSMSPANKLPLVKRSLALLARQLRADDRIAIVVYAGSSGLVLPSTPGNRGAVILGALDRLKSGGSTNGGEGIQLAYGIAVENYLEGGINRVILATDGDFNVGVTDQSELTRLIEEKRETGVFLTTLGFGMGNLNDSTLEKLANKGNGIYAYIDTLGEARKVFVEELTGSLVTIAKDVKIQVEFNPANVHAYRLIGYENRTLAAEDFKDDTVDAGEIGAGHTVTALYEIVPAGGGHEAAGIGPLRYQASSLTGKAQSRELFTVKLRYKAPEGGASVGLAYPYDQVVVGFKEASDDFQFAASVAAFGMLLRNSPHSGTVAYEDVLTWVRRVEGRSTDVYRQGFIGLVRKASALHGP
ncbi:MAG: VWA domain-containing protein [Candidatus Hydrogenedentes bacterium]|nr:VWA domain-containing protein [Candidatus Hydrogenedentota bacterium]